MEGVSLIVECSRSILAVLTNEISKVMATYQSKLVVKP